MLLIDNTSKLKNIMEFKQGSYYKFVALIRAKDYKDSDNQILTDRRRQEILVHDWMIDSKEMLNRLLPDMLKYTEMFKCRLYMCTDRRSIVKTMLLMRNKMLTYLDQLITNPDTQFSIHSLKKISSSSSKLAGSSDRDCRRWLFDIDTKSQKVLEFIKEEICGEHYLETFETKAGYHIIANKKFSTSLPSDCGNEFNYLQNKFPEISRSIIASYILDVTIQENAMVLVAMGE